MNVEAVMTRDPRSCTIQDPLHRAAQLMWDNDCGVVPVVDEKGRLRGIVTDRDICMACYTQGKPPHDIAVESVMSRTLFTLSPDDSIAFALTLFRERQVRRAPVTNSQGVLVGLLSISDVVHASLASNLGKDVKPQAVLSAVHALSKPRRTEEAATRSGTREVIIAPRPKRASASRTARKK